jgi:hypothetical protein
MSVSVQVNAALWHPHLGEYRIARLTFILAVALWVVMPCNLVSGYQHSAETCCLHL